MIISNARSLTILYHQTPMQTEFTAIEKGYLIFGKLEQLKDKVISSGKRINLIPTESFR